MKTNKILAVLIAAALCVGCYNDFDNPDPVKIYTEEEVAASGAEHLTIAEVKKVFTDKFGSTSGTGSNSSWSNTKYYQFEENVYLKGKVISDDEEGNIYKSLYLLDETGAIEIKLTNGNYLKYHPGQWIYVLLKGLYIGNYRMMLSIGACPTTSYNAVGDAKYYANSNIEDGATIAAHVLPGEQTTLTAADTLVVNAANYAEFHANTEANLGRLVRFEGVRCHYAGVENQNGTTLPELKNGSYDQIYPSWIYTDVRPVLSKAWYKWAFSVDGTCLYGSTCFTFLSEAELTNTTHYTSDHGIYVVRTSAYSNFASYNLTRHNAVGNVTGIFAIYSQQSTYKGGSGDYATYQVSLNRYSDLDFADSDFLTDTEVARMTPADSYVTPEVDEVD